MPSSSLSTRVWYTRMISASSEYLYSVEERLLLTVHSFASDRRKVWIICQHAGPINRSSAERSEPRVGPYALRQNQYGDCRLITWCTSSIASFEGAVSFKRSGASPMRVFVTARAQFEMDWRL